MVEVLAYGGEVDFEYGLVDFLLEGGGDVFEVVGAGAFDEYDGVAGFVDDGEVGQEGGGVRVEGLSAVVLAKQSWWAVSWGPTPTNWSMPRL